MPDVIIIGAGLSGLTAAERLAANGRSVLVVDKGRSVGGRLATRRIGSAVLDHGAQFFTARSELFQAAVDDWMEAGVVEEWCRGFDQHDGYPRYRTADGMNQLAKHLKNGLEAPSVEGAEATRGSVDIVTGARAASIIPLGPEVAVSYDDSATRPPDEALAVITSAPVPQTLELLDSGGIRMPQDIYDGVRALRYHKVIGLLATLSSNAPFGETGAQQRPDDPIFTFAADNQVKGISPSPSVTFHASHAVSEELYEATDAEVLKRLQPEAAARLGDAQIVEIQVKRWRYAGPVEPWPERCLEATTSGAPVVLCGDAFGGPKVEGAFLSGLAAADTILERLR